MPESNWRTLVLTGAFVCGLVLTRPAAADPLPEEISVATWNIEWFYDHYTGDNYSELAKKLSAPSRAEWDWRRSAVAEAIAKMRPTILCLQEVENQRVLYYLTKELKEKHGLTYRIAYVQGGDHYTEQDVAILYQSGLVAFEQRVQSSEMFSSGDYHNVQKHILARFSWGSGANEQKLLIVNVHLRARPEQAEIRQRQTRLMRTWIEDALRRGENVIALGDFNTEVRVDDTQPTDEMGIIRGLGGEASRQLDDLHAKLPREQRDTHMIQRAFDRILVSPALLKDTPGEQDLVFKSIENLKAVAIIGEQDDDHWNRYYEIEQGERDLSDHWPLKATFDVQ